MNTVGVVGMGYVGLTMAVALARKGFTVHGVDASPAVLAALLPAHAVGNHEQAPVQVHVPKLVSSWY